MLINLLSRLETTFIDELKLTRRTCNLSRCPQISTTSIRHLPPTRLYPIFRIPYQHKFLSNKHPWKSKLI